MECWILYHRSDYETATDDPECYEIKRIVQTGELAGLKMRVLCPEQFHLVTSHQDKVSLLLDGKEVRQPPDVLLPRMGVLSTYFALSVIRQFERMGIVVLNRSGPISTVIDKMRTQQVLAHAGLPVPKTMLAKFPVDVDLVRNSIGFPVVVKALSGTRGQGVVLCKDADQFRDIMDLLAESNSAAQILFQQFISETHGRDLRVLVVDGRIAGCMLRQSVDGNFKANISCGGKGEPYPLDRNGQRIALQTAKTLGLDIAGIDLLFSDDGYKICEANSSPGFSGMEKYCKIDVAAQIISSVQRKAARNRFANNGFSKAAPFLINSLIGSTNFRKVA